MICERCETEIEDDERVPVVYGNTNIIICHLCAVELTVFVGYWLGTEKIDDVKAWIEGMRQ